MAVNWIDKLIAEVAPGLATKRAIDRERFDLFAKKRNAFEGAGKGRRVGGWKAIGISGRGESESGLAILRNRSRDLVRNNPYAHRARSVYASNIVGTGIVPTPTFNGKSDALKARKIAALWKKWADTKKCDADGMLTFGAMQALIAKEVPTSGEILLRRKWRKNNKGLPVPMQIQILDADFIDTSKDTLVSANGEKTIQGIVYDKDDQRTGYWLYEENPYDPKVSGITSKLVPASDVIHVFEINRAGQVRGIPWFAPVILRMRDYDEYEDAQLVRQKIAACFTAFVTDVDANNPNTPSSGAKVAEQIEPGLVELLPPGRDVKFANPPGVDGYKDYANVTLHAIAAGLNIPYEALAQDLSGVNFSSGRMGWLEFQRQIENWRWHMIVPDLCVPVFEWFLEAAEMAGENIKGVDADWTAPRREMINPEAETRAMVVGVRAGLLSQPEAIRQLGDDPEKVLAEIVEFTEKLDKAGLVLDTDPRKTTQAGLLQQIGKGQPATDKAK